MRKLQRAQQHMRRCLNNQTRSQRKRNLRGHASNGEAAGSEAGSDSVERVLYAGEACGFAQKARIVADETNLPVHVQLIDLGNKPQEFVTAYAQSSPLSEPTAKTPLYIENNGTFRLIESDPVAFYLAHEAAHQTETESVLPQSNKQDARMRMFLEAGWNGTVPSYTRLLRCESWEDVHNMLNTVLLPQWQVVNQALIMYGNWDIIYPEKKPYVFGKQFTIADAIPAPFVLRMAVVLQRVYMVDLVAKLRSHGLHRAAVWVEALLQRGSVYGTAPDADGLVKHAKERFIALAV